ncbi:KH domain-containing protein HEN4-like [Chenopodium quinoa]|uniref:KH domain-containing protein HEN4-like n=1 Tax=Chenopodium quinoa TaxID=63459 RepID=UPI000B7766A6|nr:KH domain-containing protein HEN4-like [Chenopodium quinoa]
MKKTQKKPTGKPGNTTRKPHLKPPQGHVAFRLLSPVQAGSAVIGHGGAMSQKISRETGLSLLRVEDPLSGCDERIVNIVGPGNLDKTLVLRDGNGGEGERKFEVSSAQLAVFRVWDILEENTAEGYRSFRLLTVKGEEKIKSLVGIVGATIRVLPLDEHPLCADISDDLIQITGDSLATRKALLAVTYCLQGNSSRAISQFCGPVSDGVSHDLHAQKHLSIDTDAGDSGQSCVAAGTKEVAFRLLCPTYAADGLIDWGGSIMKALKRETGTRIEVIDPVVGSDECVIMVSAMEKKECQYSPAQEATLRVFTRLVEAASGSGHAGPNRGDSVTAKLLISCSQVNMLDMKDTAGAEVQILDSQCTSATLAGKKIIQV